MILCFRPRHTRFVCGVSVWTLPKSSKYEEDVRWLLSLLGRLLRASDAERMHGCGKGVDPAHQDCDRRLYAFVCIFRSSWDSTLELTHSRCPQSMSDGS